ncbi:AP-2 complex subunit sigma, partial [Aureobasidium melanogenum]
MDAKQKAVGCNERAIVGKSESSKISRKRYRRGWPKAKRAGSRGGTKSGAPGWAEADSSYTPLSPQHGHQVGSTLYLTTFARANALARYLILLSRQGKVRLAKWFTTLSPKDKAKIIKDVSQLVLARRTRMCNFLEYKDSKVVYRRYASLFFIAGCASDDNELITLEIVHRYVEQMDKYYGNVCELDIIFNFQKAYFILDELLLAGEMQESSKKNVLRCIGQQDSLEDMEVEDESVTRIMSYWWFCDLHLDNDTTTCAILAIQMSVPRLRQGFRVLDLLLNYNDHPTMPILVQALGVTLLLLLLSLRLSLFSFCSHGLLLSCLK